MNQLRLTYRDFRLLVLGVHEAGMRLKEGCTFAERNSGNDVLEVAHKVDAFLTRAERRHTFLVSLLEPDEKTDEHTDPDETVHRES